jgi:cytochrome c peroxidase
MREAAPKAQGDERRLGSACRLLGVAVVAIGCAHAPETPLASVRAENPLRARARKVLAALPAAALPSDAISQKRIALGRRLFFEAAVGIDGKTSCATCHLPERYGAEAVAKSVGVFGRAHIHNSPTVFNSALSSSQGWRGQYATVEEQAGEILLSPVASGNSSVAEVVKRLGAKGYEPAFRAAFPGEKQPLSGEAFGVAVGAFERTLLTPAPFDRFLNGDDAALSEKAQRGLSAFLVVGCASCHDGPGVGGRRLATFGVHESFWKVTGSEVHDNGRFEVTQEEADRYVFKVPSLRNVAETAPYFHDGSVATLGAAIRVGGQTQLTKPLTDAQASDIEEFLRSLTGQKPESFSPPN